MKIIVYLDNGQSITGELLAIMPFTQKWIKVQTKKSEVQINMQHVTFISYPNHPLKKK